jgi:flagellar hook-associated protein FlgK
MEFRMSITDTFSIASSGLAAAQTQLNVTANNIANLNTPNYTPSRVDSYAAANGDGVETQVQSVPGDDDDLARQMMDLSQAKMLYGANAAVIRAGDRMIGSLLDIFDDGSDPNQRDND